MTRHATYPTTLLGILLAALFLAAPGTVFAKDDKAANRQGDRHGNYDQDQDRNGDRNRGRHQSDRYDHGKGKADEDNRDGYGRRHPREHDERSLYDQRSGRRDRVEQERPSNKSLERWWRELPGNEQRRLMYDYDRYRKLDPDRRDHVEDRWQRFRDLPPEQQDRLRHDYRRYQELPSGDKERLQRTWRHYQELPPGQREQLKKELRELKGLPDEDRERRRQDLYRRYFPDLPPPPPRKNR